MKSTGERRMDKLNQQAVLLGEKVLNFLEVGTNSDRERTTRALLYALRLTMGVACEKESHQSYQAYLARTNDIYLGSFNEAEQLGHMTIKYGIQNLEWDANTATYKVKGHSSAEEMPYADKLQ